MSQPPETPTDARRGGFGTLAWVIGLLLAVYVLSVGPVAKLMEHDVIGEKLFAATYAPLGWLCQNCKPVGDFIAWYVEDVWHLR